MAARVRRQDHEPVPAHGRLDGLPPRALHDGPRLRARGDDVLRPPLPQGLDLPRQPDHQLVSVPPDVPLRPGTRARGDRRRAHVCALPARGRLWPHHDRDRAPRNDPRRRRRRRSPRRRALQGSDRPRGRRPCRRAPRADHRRRARRDGVRHGRAQGYARARSDRLRDRPRPRAPRADADRPGRAHERARGRPRRAHAGGGERARDRLAQGARPAREARELPSLRRAL